MTQGTSLKTVALMATAAAATTLLVQACGGSAEAQTADGANAIEGVWESSVTIKDCASGAVQRTFRGETVFHRGGTLTADNSLPVPSRSISLGVWTQDTPGGYTAKFRFLRFNPDGSLAGAQKVSRTIVLSANATTMTSTITGQVLDPAEAPVAQICGTETGVRIY